MTEHIDNLDINFDKLHVDIDLDKLQVKDQINIRIDNYKLFKTILKGNVLKSVFIYNRDCLLLALKTPYSIHSTRLLQWNMTSSYYVVFNPDTGLLTEFDDRGSQFYSGGIDIPDNKIIKEISIERSVDNTNRFQLYLQLRNPIDFNDYCAYFDDGHFEVFDHSGGYIFFEYSNLLSCVLPLLTSDLDYQKVFDQSFQEFMSQEHFDVSLEDESDTEDILYYKFILTDILRDLY
jgi:hypothetical protein